MNEWIASIIPGKDKCAGCVLNPSVAALKAFVCLCTHTCLNIHIIIRVRHKRGKLLNLKPGTNFSFKDTYEVVCKSDIKCDKLFKWNHP